MIIRKGKRKEERIQSLDPIGDLCHWHSHRVSQVGGSRGLRGVYYFPDRVLGHSFEKVSIRFLWELRLSNIGSHKIPPR